MSKFGRVKGCPGWPPSCVAGRNEKIGTGRSYSQHQHVHSSGSCQYLDHVIKETIVHSDCGRVDPFFVQRWTTRTLNIELKQPNELFINRSRSGFNLKSGHLNPSAYIFVAERVEIPKNVDVPSAKMTDRPNRNRRFDCFPF